MFAETLRKELSTLAKTNAGQYKHSLTSKSGVVIFRADEQTNTHGNFYTPTYKNILAHPEWKKRLERGHQAAARSFPDEKNIRQLDSCMSSDALLMNIFCHPDVNRWEGLKSLLGVTTIVPQFGFKAKVKKSGKGDTSEIDMKLQELLVEAKLTEPDFQRQSPGIVDTYDRLEQVFHMEVLPKQGGQYLNYQLIRNFLAVAEPAGYRFCLICDSRRPDLVRAFDLMKQFVKDIPLREKIGSITWQQIAQAVEDNDLKAFLRKKYGLGA